LAFAAPPPPEMSARGRYARILRAPHVTPLIVAALVARLPIGIDSIAIVLFLRERTGSYAAAGIVSAAFALGGGVGAPLAGRLVDRFGHRRVLVPLALVHGGGLALLVGLGLLDAPVALLLPVALVGGAAIPPISATMRPLWGPLLGGDAQLLPAAYALDSIIIELVFTIGPLLTALATALLSPAAALGLAAVLVVAGTLAFTASPPSRAWTPDPERAGHGWLGALSSPGLRTLVLATLPLGFCFGAVEVTLPAFTEDMATRAWAGVLLAVWSLGSAAGGLVYGARADRMALAPTYVRLAALLPLTFLPLAAAPSLVTMVPLCVLAGVAIAPLFASGNQLVGDVAPAGALTEAYTWLVTAIVVGVAIGNAVAGVLVEAADWRVSFLVGAGCGAVGSLLAFARRETLSPVAA
jgi:MFS family permease